MGLKTVFCRLLRLLYQALALSTGSWRNSKDL